MSEPGTVRVEMEGPVAVLTLDRPPMNALDAGFAKAFGDAFAELEGSEDVRAVVLTGAGPAFSAGIDLQELPDLEPSEQDVLLGVLNRMFAGVYASRLPVVGAIGGHAIAAGLVLALCCDHTVVGAGGKHGLPEVSVGVRFPAVAGEAVGAELTAKTLRRLVLDGTLLASDEAVALGVYDEQAGDPLARALEVAARRAEHDPEVYGDLKHGLRALPMERMAAVIAGGDPLEGQWLSEAMRERARATLEH